MAHISRSRVTQPIGIAVAATLAWLTAGGSHGAESIILKDLTVRTIDGDTVSVSVSSQVIRLYGVDACEKGQEAWRADGARIDCGEVAKNALEGWTRNRLVQCRVTDTDRYGRSIAVCGTSEVPDFAAELVRQGLAVAYRYKSKAMSRAYEQLEQQAKLKREGLWAWEFDEPWVYRTKKK